MSNKKEISEQQQVEQLFVSYRIAEMLTKIGFQQKCLGYFSNWGTQEPFLLTCEYGTEKESCSIRRKNYLCSAPTWQQAMSFCLVNHKMGFQPNFYKLELMEEELFDLVDYIYRIENDLPTK